jgi:uncharacterized protein involved in cysteine biosynthesis
MAVDPTANVSPAKKATPTTTAVWLAVGVVDVILALDFVFKLVAAANVGFLGFISMVAGSLAAPFRGVLASSVRDGFIRKGG